MTRALVILTFLARAVSSAKGDGMCRGRAECDSGDDTSSALLQLPQLSPVSRGPLQRADEAPYIDCRNQANNGTCWAQQTACVLMGMMTQWQSYNTGINKVKDQLRDQCYNKATGTTTEEEEEVRRGAAGTMGTHCYGKRYYSCVTDVGEYYEKNPGAEFGMRAAKATAQFVTKYMSLVLKDAKAIALTGSVFFAFVGAIISNFFPSSGGPPTNPCTYATDWAECVWGQIGPLVANFVGIEIEGVFADLWQAHLQGYQALLWKINRTAYLDSPNFPKMPPKVRDRMFSELNDLNDDMWDGAPFFAQDKQENTAAGIYLSMFSSLHVSVMTTLFGTWKYRTPGDRYTSQTLILCYARKVLAHALKTRNRRLLLVSRKVLDPRSHCWHCQRAHPPPSRIVDEWDCCGETVLYRDQSRGCSWNETCGPQVQCGPAVGQCTQLRQRCSRSSAENAYNCHKDHVQKESDEMWEQWLAPIPAWIELVKKMQEAEVRIDGKSGARQGGGPRKAKGLEGGDMGTCPF